LICTSSSGSPLSPLREVRDDDFFEAHFVVFEFFTTGAVQAQGQFFDVFAGATGLEESGAGFVQAFAKAEVRQAGPT
jgi:hypothetical protein